MLRISIGGDDIGDFWRSKRKIEESWRTYGASDMLTASDSDVRMKAVNGLASTVVKGSRSTSKTRSVQAVAWKWGKVWERLLELIWERRIAASR